MDSRRALDPPRKAVLATFGTLGDVYPFVALATAIRARGIDTLIAAPEPFRDTIEAEGIRFTPIRPRIQDVCDALGVDVAGAYRMMRANPHFILDEIYMRFLRETYEDVLEAARGADVILIHSLLVGAHLAAETLRLPSARVALAPLHLQSATSPSSTPSAPYMPPRLPGALPYNRLVRRLVRLAVTARMRRLPAFRRSIGLPKADEDVFLDFGRPNHATKVFGMFSSRFAAAQPDPPRNLEVVGFPFVDPADASRRSLDAALGAFLEAGPPPIVFTLGSFAPSVSGAFYDVSLRAARALGRRSVLLAGARDAARLKETAGADVFVCAAAPHAPLFPKCRCIVHHGGIGTTGEAMRAGKPQVVVPFFGDQPDNAARIRRLGLGVSLVLSRYDERRAGDALRTVMRDDTVRRADAFATSLRSDMGVDRVARWVEGVVDSARAAA